MKTKATYELKQMNIALDQKEVEELLGILIKVSELPHAFELLRDSLREISRYPMSGAYSGNLKKT